MSWSREYLARSETRQAILVYVVGTALLLFGGIYSLWRVKLLSDYLAANRAYVQERDVRWDQYIDNQTKLTQEILRRLPRKD